MRSITVLLATAFAGAAFAATAVQAEPINISTWAHGAPLQEAVIATQPDLLKKIPGEVKWLPISSGPAALAGMKGGAYNIVNGVGNPPVTTAIANGLDIKVVWAQFYDNAGLVLDASLSPEQMAGKTFGTLQGSSEDFAFNGWLEAKGLAGKVRLVGLERQAMVAAFKTKAISGGVNSEPGVGQMIADGGKLVATTREMGALGYPALDVVVVDGDFAKKRPDVVQAYVCAQYAAYKLMTGSTKDEVFRKAAAFVGADPEQAVKVGTSWPIWKPEDELTERGLGAPGKIAEGEVAKAYFRTGAWLKKAGRLENPPSMEAIVSHIDPTYAQKALAGGCN
ncbi:NitT/TauT family transport system substrate-binding protein [Enhydrobacter aerosaccus]|uniref:NitT/TauT family transport system substrate-binding protein n=1 Tax=Enhydrobacter aerosaccus TaxID=225324 RepID=A0A1T4SVC5_9HYPH|nr:ABC transporter substrate-binding protein [Enhydrobacter aerosaccus]SKA32117.1 NitT/TauT family transport system substrate-binding protein [Enhydrobacter aerosaccus]